MSNTPNTVEILYKKITEKLGVADLPPELQQDLIGEVGDIVVRSVIVRAIEVLPEEAVDAFNELTEKEEAGVDELFTYLEEHAPDFEEIVIEEGNRIVEEWQDAVAQAENEDASAE